LAAAPREYELVLMLDPRQDASARDAMAQEARKQIEAGGALKHENNWGLRKMAYEIDQRTEADYRWLRFEAPTELLEQLGHNLKIADGVLRFRIFKVDPEAPVIVPPPTSGAAPGASRGRQEESAARPAPDAAAAVAVAEPSPEPGPEGAGGEPPSPAE
jgi:small subunit ribosomal protein S6